ncbi:hypothetical protein F1C58_02385 [Glaciihabitans sp. INWT7]|uniref:hypothetical protein n=1 Tax=Glaciihabitans sp. INWT7 TaxID=2596912 RepID=UPI001629D193|nr:hypothetical protein [Glaciihabitans sp. INWT7]QNE45868.1 hypothetical protein F1C58_02385 [Glaciihabitans sp. INWT7]
MQMPIELMEDIPEPVRHLIEAVSRPGVEISPTSLRRAHQAGRNFGPEGARLSGVNRGDDFLFAAAGVSTRLAEAAGNVRAIINAYGQVVANPRPDLTQLARWQDVSPGGLRHRYTEAHVIAIRHVMSDDPLVDAILDPLPGVFDEDLRGVSPAIDRQLEVRAEMRVRCGEEMEKLFGKNPQAVVLDAAGVSSFDLGRYRLIADLGDVMRVTLARIEPVLAEQYVRWVEDLLVVRKQQQQQEPRRRDRKNS